MSDGDEDEERVRVVADVPKSVKEAAKRKLPHGGITTEIEEALQRVAFGEELNQRSRLERQLRDYREEREELRDRRREIDAELEAVENKITGLEERMAQLSSREERYESKLEELEFRLRGEGSRLFPGYKAIDRVAKEVQIEPEGVIKDLKERNPDVPDYAFEEKMPYSDGPTWNGVPEEDVDLPVDQREAKYR